MVMLPSDETFERFADYLMFDRGHARTTIRTYCGVMRQFFTWSADNGLPELTEDTMRQCLRSLKDREYSAATLLKYMAAMHAWLDCFALKVRSRGTRNRLLMAGFLTR